MFTSGFDHMLYFKVRQQELLHEAQQHRLVKEALKVRSPQARRHAKILAAIGSRLMSLVSSLEERYSSSPQIEIFQQGIGEEY